MHKFSIPKIKLNRIKCASLYKFYNKMFKQCHMKMTGFKNPFSPSISKSFHIYFNSSQNISSVLLLNSLVMVTNKGHLIGTD